MSQVVTSASKGIVAAKASGRKSRVALVVPDISIPGGVPNIAAFLYQVLTESDRYIPEIISLATSASDNCSVRLLSPKSWLRGVQVTAREWDHRPYRHVGAAFTELEFQRYRSRRVLSEILNQYDLVQVVAGTPAWALVTRNVQRPVCLFTATTIQQERATLFKQTTGRKWYWLTAMTHINARMELRALSHISYVFAESEYTRANLGAYVEKERLLLGVPGIDTSFFFPTAYRQNGYILSIGRFGDPRKNIRLLFDAYHQLRQTMVDAPKLVLAGQTNPSAADWEYATSLGLSKQIEIHQDVSLERLRELYQNAALFVLSSDEEGLGIVILEAMACGIPVISTRCGGPETAVVDGVTGYLTPVRDALAMASKMRELIADPSLRQSMGQAGRRVIDEQFSLEFAGRVYLDKYDELLGYK